MKRIRHHSRPAFFPAAAVAGLLLPLCAATARAQEPFLRGDGNADGSVDISDCVHDLVYLFRDGLPPICLDAADTDDSGTIGIEDPISVLNYLFRNGAPPPAPGPSECGGDPTADGLDCAESSPRCLPLGRPTFDWSIQVSKAPTNSPFIVRAEPEDSGQIGGPVSGRVDLGAFLVVPEALEEADGLNAAAEVYATEDAHTYWVRAQAPGIKPSDPEYVTSSQVDLAIDQYLLKQSADATLRMVISGASLDMISSPALGHIAEECPGGYYHQLVQVIPGVFDAVPTWDAARLDDCDDLFYGVVLLDVAVSVPGLGSPRQVYRDIAYAKLHGFAHAWRWEVESLDGLWRTADFDFDPDVGGGGQQLNARLALEAPLVVEVPLESVEVGEVMAVHIEVSAYASNFEARESYASAFFRDPLDSDGIALELDGLERVRSPGIAPPVLEQEPAAECRGTADPAAGVIEFDAAAYFAAELPGIGAPIAITRSGGSAGDVSVLFSTADGGEPEAPDFLGAATAGSDYEAVARHVVFRDGEDGRRVVLVPLVLDELAEPDEAVRLTLSDPRGCAALGERASAVLRIRDDDLPLPVEPEYTVGGTVSGLLGSGLQLEDRGAFVRVDPRVDGPFAFGYARHAGDAYDVRVVVQPTEPIQVCTVTNGVGTVGDADVTDIVVECAAPAATDGLDTSFGDGGRVASELSGGARAIAIQADGKLIVVGQRALMRHHTDGSVDGSFGTNGTAIVVFGGKPTAEPRDVAIQSDGSILVAGYAGVGATLDFAVSRFTPDGQLDMSFGAAGTALVDFAVASDRAYSVLVQPDDRIVLAGYSSTAAAGADYAAARLTSDGVVDASFGAGGTARTNLAGLTDLGAAAALQADGRIVVAGRAATSGSANPDVGLVRYNADGTLDTSFGVGGIVLVDLTDGDWDEATAVAIGADGSIVVAVLARIVDGSRADNDFAVARFTSTGSLDSSFGASGFASTDFGLGNDVARGLAVEADGGIVLAGQARSATVDDLALARYTAAGELDASFGEGGVLTVDFFGRSDGAYDVVAQPDGKIVVAGAAVNGVGSFVGLGMVRVAR